MLMRVLYMAAKKHETTALRRPFRGTRPTIGVSASDCYAARDALRSKNSAWLIVALTVSTL
jgi:hypothetical protein